MYGLLKRETRISVWTASISVGRLLANRKSRWHLQCVWRKYTIYNIIQLYVISKRSTFSNSALPFSYSPIVASGHEFIFSARLTMTAWTLVSGQSLAVDRLCMGSRLSLITVTQLWVRARSIYWWQALSTARATIEITIDQLHVYVNEKKLTMQPISIS